MSVTMSTKCTPLNRVGLTIEAKNSDGTIIGELTMSQGGIQWRPSKRHNGGPKHPYIRWSRLGSVLIDEK
jgi:hypothetical protein